MGNFFSELFGTLFFAGIIALFAIAFSNEKPEVEKRQDLLKHGYTQHEVDSIISKQNSDFLYTVLNAAG